MELKFALVLASFFAVRGWLSETSYSKNV